MSNLQKPKADTPVKMPSNSFKNKAITVNNIWSLLSDINNKVNSYDTGIKDINIKLSSFESLFIVKSLW